VYSGDIECAMSTAVRIVGSVVDKGVEARVGNPKQRRIATLWFDPKKRLEII